MYLVHFFLAQIDLSCVDVLLNTKQTNLESLVCVRWLYTNQLNVANVEVIAIRNCMEKSRVTWTDSFKAGRYEQCCLFYGLLGVPYAWRPYFLWPFLSFHPSLRSAQKLHNTHAIVMYYTNSKRSWLGTYGQLNWLILFASSWQGKPKSRPKSVEK